ncbi:hypothetical protein ACU686_09290 [Yinghuangia aomiensis]
MRSASRLRVAQQVVAYGPECRFGGRRRGRPHGGITTVSGPSDG